MENAKTYGYIYKITVKETGQYYIGQHKAYRPGEVEKTYWGSGKIIYNIKRKHKDFENYLERLLDRKAFDRMGLIYGMGHAVYSISDPRQRILKGAVQHLAEVSGFSEEFDLYAKVERLAPQVIGKKRKIYKGVASNVDFYSGLLYSMLDIPCELYTPLFATARIAGWSAHRLEELINAGKIIRPAYMSISTEKKYVALDKR